jgi:hypothetical protein
MWSLVSLIDWNKTIFTQLILFLSGTSFGVYIFHNWLEAFMISTTAQRLLHLGKYAADHTILFPFMFSLLAYAVSLAVTWLLLQTKIGKHLIG